MLWPLTRINVSASALNRFFDEKRLWFQIIECVSGASGSGCALQRKDKVGVPENIVPCIHSLLEHSSRHGIDGISAYTTELPVLFEDSLLMR